MIFRNSEHYCDPTAGAAIANVMRESKALRPNEPAEPLDENFEDLANAIIIQQAEDYRKCRKILRARPGKKQVSFFVQDEANKRLREIEVFFQSWWFSRLTTADGKMILERLKKEEDENDSKGISAAGLSA